MSEARYIQHKTASLPEHIQRRGWGLCIAAVRTWRAVETMNTPGREIDVLETHGDVTDVIKELSMGDAEIRTAIDNVFSGDDSCKHCT